MGVKRKCSHSLVSSSQTLGLAPNNVSCRWPAADAHCTLPSAAQWRKQITIFLPTSQQCRMKVQLGMRKYFGLDSKNNALGRSSLFRACWKGKKIDFRTTQQGVSFLAFFEEYLVKGMIEMSSLFSWGFCHREGRSRVDFYGSESQMMEMTNGSLLLGRGCSGPLQWLCAASQGRMERTDFGVSTAQGSDVGSLFPQPPTLLLEPQVLAPLWLWLFDSLRACLHYYSYLFITHSIDNKGLKGPLPCKLLT